MQHLDWEANYIRETQLDAAALRPEGGWGGQTCNQHGLPLLQQPLINWPHYRFSMCHAHLLRIKARFASSWSDSGGQAIEWVVTGAEERQRLVVGWGGYLIGDSAGQFVHPGSGFGNLLRSVDHIWGVLQGTFTSGGGQIERKKINWRESWNLQNCGWSCRDST